MWGPFRERPNVHPQPKDNKLRAVHLTTQAVAELREGDDLYSALSSFEPLPFPAGERAGQWLRSRLKTKDVPVETQVLLNDEGTTVLGFYAIRPIALELSRRDHIKLAVRKRGVKWEPQPALLLSWIARSAKSDPGFGRQLFLHAVGNALLNEYVALIIEPDDEDIKRHWIRKYRCMEVDRDPPGTLWFPVDEPARGWPS